MWAHFGRRRAQNGNTALIWAGYKGHKECARLLLDAGADKNAKNNVRALVLCDFVLFVLFGGIICLRMIYIESIIVSSCLFRSEMIRRRFVYMFTRIRFHWTQICSQFCIFFVR